MPHPGDELPCQRPVGWVEAGWGFDIYSPNILFLQEYDYVENQIPQGWGKVSASNAVKIPYKSPPIPGGRGGGGGVVGHAVDRCIMYQPTYVETQDVDESS